MPRLIALADDVAADLDSVAAAIDAQGFDPDDPASLDNAARWLRRLGNNRNFLSDAALAALKQRYRDADAGGGYGAQVLMLHRPAGGAFIRANIWPPGDDPVVRASGEAVFFYGIAHNHNFGFLTLGYAGPGYASDCYDYEPGQDEAAPGTSVDLKPSGRHALRTGDMMLYAAHRDVHCQHPPSALSVSLNIVSSRAADRWHDQFRFDLETGTIAGLLSRSPAGVLVRLAVALDIENGRDLAEQLAIQHPSPRMRWDAVRALAGACAGDDAEATLYRRFAASDAALVRTAARKALDRLDRRA